MKITQEADYAVRIVSCLAQNETRQSAAAIAAEMHVTLRFTLKILHKLVAAGIAQSFKGAGGGYRLTRPPGEITLRQVVEAIDGPLLLNRCLAQSADCSRLGEQKACCPFHRAFADVSSLVAKTMDGYTFDVPLPPKSSVKKSI